MEILAISISGPHAFALYLWEYLKERIRLLNQRNEHPVQEKNQKNSLITIGILQQLRIQITLNFTNNVNNFVCSLSYFVTEPG
jgi:hypothetical protein